MIKQARNPDSFLPEFISISSSTVSKAVSWGCDNRTWVITWILTNSNEKALDVESAMNPATEQSTFICLASSTSSRSYLLQLHLKKIWFLIKYCVFIRYKLLSFVLGCFGFFFQESNMQKTPQKHKDEYLKLLSLPNNYLFFPFLHSLTLRLFKYTRFQHLLVFPHTPMYLKWLKWNHKRENY